MAEGAKAVNHAERRLDNGLQTRRSESEDACSGASEASEGTGVRRLAPPSLESKGVDVKPMLYRLSNDGVASPHG